MLSAPRATQGPQLQATGDLEQRSQMQEGTDAAEPFRASCGASVTDHEGKK